MSSLDVWYVLLPSTHIKRATVGPPAKHHFNGEPIAARECFFCWLWSSFIYTCTYGPWHEISNNNVVCATSKGSDQTAHTRRLIRALASRLSTLRLFSYWPNIIWDVSLKGGCTGSSESTFVKMPNCWKSHVAAHIQ